MPRRGDTKTGIIGHPADGREEGDHLEPCPICGQSFDMRDLDQVMHHAQPEHRPMLRVVGGIDVEEPDSAQ